MTSLQETILGLLLYDEPEYQFQYNEAKVAKRMADKGLLKPIKGTKGYKVTKKGERLYNNYIQANRKEDAAWSCHWERRLLDL